MVTYNMKVLPRALLLLAIVMISTEANPIKRFFENRRMMMMMRSRSMDDEDFGQACDARLAESLASVHAAKVKAEQERDEVLATSGTAAHDARLLKRELDDYMKKLEASFEEQANMKAKFEIDMAQMKKWWTAKEVGLQQDHAREKAEFEKASAEAKAKIEELEKKLVKIPTQSGASSEGHVDMKARIDADVEQMKKRWTAQEVAIKQKHASEVATLEKELARAKDKIEKLEEKAAKKETSAEQNALNGVRQTEQSLMKQMNEIKKQAEEEIKALVQQIEGKKMEIAEAKKQLLDMKLEMVAQSEKQLKTFLEEKMLLEQKQNETMTNFKLEMDLKIKQVDEAAQKRIDQIVAENNERVAQSTSQLNDATADFQQHKAKMVDIIDKLESEKKDIKKKMSMLSKKYELTLEDLEVHRTRAKARSYCNLTMVQEDVIATVSAIGKAAANSIKSEDVIVATKAATASISRAAQPHLQQGQKLYESHVKEHVDRHILPIHESHVQPVLNQVHEQIKETTTVASDYASDVRRTMIREIGMACPQLKRKVKNYRPLIRYTVQTQCKDPESAVDRALMGIALLLCVIFRRTLFHVLLALIYLPFKIMWYLSPLPFIVPKVKGDEPSPKIVSVVPEEVLSSKSKKKSKKSRSKKVTAEDVSL